MMRENDYALSAWYSVKMPDNYVIAFDPPKGEKVTRLLRAADGELDAIAAWLAFFTGSSVDFYQFSGNGPGTVFIRQLLPGPSHLSEHSPYVRKRS